MQGSESSVIRTKSQEGRSRRKRSSQGQTEKDSQRATSIMCCHRSQGKERFKKEDVIRVKCSKKGPVKDKKSKQSLLDLITPRALVILVRLVTVKLYGEK